MKSVKKIVLEVEEGVELVVKEGAEGELIVKAVLEGSNPSTESNHSSWDGI